MLKNRMDKMACEYCIICGMPLDWDDTTCPRCGQPKQ